MRRTSKTRFLSCGPALASLAALMFTAVVLAYPKPASVPYRWELDFEPGELRLWVDTAGESAAYWYFNYKVTNRTGRDQVWAPSFIWVRSAQVKNNCGMPVKASILWSRRSSTAL